MVALSHKHHPGQVWALSTPANHHSSHWKNILDLAQTSAHGGPRAPNSGLVGKDVMFLGVSENNTVC